MCTILAFSHRQASLQKTLALRASMRSREGDIALTLPCVYLSPIYLSTIYLSTIYFSTVHHSTSLLYIPNIPTNLFVFHLHLLLCYPLYPLLDAHGWLRCLGDNTLTARASEGILTHLFKGLDGERERSLVSLQVGT